MRHYRTDRSNDDASAIGLLLLICHRFPVVGAITSSICVVVGAILCWVIPTSLHFMGWIIGVVLFTGGLVIAMVTMLGYFRGNSRQSKLDGDFIAQSRRSAKARRR